MDNLKNFIFYGKIFNKNQLSEIINKAHSLKTKRQCDSKSKYSQKGNRNVSSDINIGESCHNMMLKKYLLNLPEKYKTYFFELLKKQYFVDEKITKYDINDEYDWHTDFLIRQNSCRCISTITYLNDDYCGGDTEFFGKKIKSKKGNTLMFPSFWLYPHKGSPVISGRKLIYVCHFWFTSNDTNSFKINSTLSYT